MAKNAAHANKMAAKLAARLASWQGYMCHPVEANEIFIQLPEAVIEGLVADGFQFYRWEGEHLTTLRLVTAFNTRKEDVCLYRGGSTLLLGDPTILH